MKMAEDCRSFSSVDSLWTRYLPAELVFQVQNDPRYLRNSAMKWVFPSKKSPKNLESSLIQDSSIILGLFCKEKANLKTKEMW